MPLKLKAIKSGGQTGADQGGLYAGEALGLVIGGYAPKGFYTEDGYNHELLRDRFGLKETTSPTYPPRTRLNVQATDGTVIFGNESSAGSRCTIKFCVKEGKPYTTNPVNYERFREWLELHNIETLNVAGNRESSNPGIQERVTNWLVEALKDHV